LGASNFSNASLAPYHNQQPPILISQRANTAAQCQLSDSDVAQLPDTTYDIRWVIRERDQNSAHEQVRSEVKAPEYFVFRFFITAVERVFECHTLK